MFGRRKKEDEDPFAALRDGSTYQSTPTTFTGLGSTGLESNGLPSSGLASSGLGSSGLGSSGLGFSGVAPDAPAAKVSVPPSRATQAPSVTAAARPARAWPSPPTPRRAGRSGRSAPRRTARGVRFVVFGIVFAVIAINVVRSIHTSSSGSVTSTTLAPPSAPPSTSTPATPPAKRGPVSYLTPNGLRAGLAEVKKLAPGAGLTLLRVDARSFLATAALRNGGGKSISLEPSGTFVFATGTAGAHPVPVSAIKPNAMGRLTTNLNHHFHVRPNQIDYMVVSSASGAEWFIFTKVRSHQQFSASLNGGDLTAIG
jgi:hypothetical protein